MDLCVRAGYIDVNSSDNAIKICGISGLDNSLQSLIYNSVADYCKDNEILAVIVENSKDMAIINKAQQEKISTNKYTLIQSLLNYEPNATIEELKGESEKKLIDKIKQYHEKTTLTYSEEQLANKRTLIDFNRIKYAEHLENITEESKKEFENKFTQNLKEQRPKYQENFNASYITWKHNHTNFIA